jgi:hypothetical protein
MVNYQQGKIYKITSGDLTYIGSTCETTLARRLSKHKENYKRWLIGKQHYMTSYRILENDDAEIFLIESFPCNSKDELHSRERYHIETTDCVNKNIPTRTIKEWIEDNKDKIQQYQKLYRQDNKNKTKDYNKTYYETNQDHLIEYQQKYKESNKDKLKERKQAYYEANKDKLKKNAKLYHEANKEKIKEQRKEYFKAYFQKKKLKALKEI